MRWGIAYADDIISPREVDILALRMGVKASWDWVKGNPCGGRMLVIHADIGRPEAVTLLQRHLCNWHGMFERAIVISIVPLPVPRGYECLTLGLILPYFHHIPALRKSLSERKIVLHYATRQLRDKGTDKVIALHGLIERLGYRLVIFSWYERPQGIPQGIEWHCKLEFDEVFELMSGARLFLTATTWDSWSRTALYALKFHVPPLVLDTGATLPLWLRMVNPHGCHVYDTLEGVETALHRLLTDDALWQETVEGWVEAMNEHPLIFDEYAIADEVRRKIAPFPRDFIPSHGFYWVKGDAFPHDITCLQEDTILLGGH